MRKPDREALACRIRAAKNGETAGVGLGELLDELLIQTLPEDTGERGLSIRVVERLDVVREDPARFLALADDLSTLLLEASTDQSAAELLELVAERGRTVEILDRHLGGTVSRTSLLSFISSQRWPQAVKRRFESETRDRPRELRKALVALDVPLLESLLVPDVEM